MIVIFKRTFLFILTAISISHYGCRETLIPRPEGYLRIDFPQKQYQVFKDSSAAGNKLPFSFEYPVYGRINPDINRKNEPGWFNINFPRYNATIYLTYKKINKDFDDLMEQTYKMNVKNHVTRADAINEQEIINDESRVYGILYDLKGNTASAVQFYVTDSIKHYLRGSLYFSAEPNADSLAPVITFFRDDIIHMIETLKWQ